MINTRTKGNRIRLKCMKALRQSDYLVEISERIGNTYGQKDLFGLFDLTAIKSNIVLFIQVTCNTPHTHKKFVAFAKKYAGTHLMIQQWVWMDRTGWKTFYYYNTGKYEVTKNW